VPSGCDLEMETSAPLSSVSVDLGNEVPRTAVGWLCAMLILNVTQLAAHSELKRMFSKEHSITTLLHF